MSQDGLQQLLRQIDERYDSRIAELQAELSGLEAERNKDYEAAKRLWPILSTVVRDDSTGQEEREEAGYFEAESSQTDSPGKLFPLQTEIKKLLEPMTGDVTQPMMLGMLIEKFPFLQAKVKDGQLGSQVSGALKRLKDQGLLEIVTESYSNFPRVYRRIAASNGHAEASLAE